MSIVRQTCIILVLPVGILLGGCDRSGGDFGLGSLTGSDRVAFRCDDDRSFRVNYNNDGDEAVVDAGDETYRLDLRDRDGDRGQLTVSGNEARLQISGDADYSDCEQI